MFSFNRRHLNDSDQNMERINEGIKTVFDINEEISYDDDDLFQQNNSIKTCLFTVPNGYRFPAVIKAKDRFNHDVLIFAEPHVEVDEIRIER